MYIYFNMLHAYSHVRLLQCVSRVHSVQLLQCVTSILSVQLLQRVTRVQSVQLFRCVTRVHSCTFSYMCYMRTLVHSYFNVLHAYSCVLLFQCVTRILSCTFTSVCYTCTLVFSYFNVLPCTLVYNFSSYGSTHKNTILGSVYRSPDLSTRYVFIQNLDRIRKQLQN